MMKKFILLIDSLVQTFSFIESGSEITFKYQNKNNLDVFKGIGVGDIILGYFSEPLQQVKCIFEVIKTLDSDSIILLKKFEVSIGAKIGTSIIKSIENNTIIEINDECYSEIINKLLVGIGDPKEDENIFNGFAGWLTSYDNPDYTGKEKYSGYPRCLERLVQFMADNNLIDDANLNDKNSSKFINIKTAYDNSEEAKDFDEKHLSYKAGIAALKKYIKYVEFLSSKKEHQLETKNHVSNMEVVCESIPINLSVADLGNILANMYNNASQGNQSNAIRMFGVKYGGVISDNAYTATAIIKASGLNSSYDAEVSKGISIYKSIRNNEYGVHFYDSEEKQPLVTIPATCFDFSFIKGFGVNKIFYGTPGCGKSYHIQHSILEKENYLSDNIIRTTFYQDYSNTDFVGQILPKVEKDTLTGKETVKYIFNPGPFTLALIRAISNPKEKVALIVEEINRGNAPAIFGDIFQLLDRDINAVSEYGIVNVSMMDYLNDYVFEVNGEKKKYIFKDIKIPGNMSIFATMNTSDQNVYTLDTAFVRRWEKEKIKNNVGSCSFANTSVPGMDYTWKEFVEAINKHIAKHLEDLQVNEDKQIGAYFVKESLLLSKDPEKFAYKIFDYLWSDVAKLDHGIFFNHYDTLEALISAYKTNGVSVFKSGIFDKKEPTKMMSEDENDE